MKRCAFWRWTLLIPIGLLLALGSANAQEGGSEKTVSLPELDEEKSSEAGQPDMPDFKNGAPRWYPPTERPAKWEWVELTTGEWLKGNIKGIRNDKMDFDSDQFDDLTLDMEDVVQTYSSVVNTFVFTRRRVVIGIGHITAKEVIIDTAAGQMRYPRQELLSLVVGDHNEWKLWSGSVTAGVSATSGNTEQTTANLQASLNRKGAFLGLKFNYIGNLGSSDNVTNVNNQQLLFQSELFIYDRFFLIPASFEYYSDEFQNINLRVRPGAGVGYELIDTTHFTWSLNSTAIYELQESISSVQSQASRFESFAIGLKSNLKYELTSDITFTINYALTLAIPDTNHVDQQTIAKIDVDITKYLSLNTTLNWQRVGDPVPLEDGTVPKQNDLILTLGASIDF